MNGQGTQQNNTLAGLTVQTDIALWRLLLHGSRRSHKFTRVEAFYDLIERHCIALLKGESDYIGGTIHNMAETWGWNRETVARFLDNLQQLGMVSVDTEGHRKMIKITCAILHQTHPEAPEMPSDAKTPSPAANGT